jgi:hypothetical protein
MHLKFFFVVSNLIKNLTFNNISTVYFKHIQNNAYGKCSGTVVSFYIVYEISKCYCIRNCYCIRYSNRNLKLWTTKINIFYRLCLNNKKYLLIKKEKGNNKIVTLPYFQQALSANSEVSDCMKNLKEGIQ